MPAGRPSKYSAALVATICDRIAKGQTLREICRDDAIPSTVTLLRWLDKHEEFRTQYARAKELQAEHFADEILEIADDGTNDWIERRRSDGSTETVIDHEHVQRSRLRVDSRKWLMSKMLPKKYGDRTAIVGADDAPPVMIGIVERVIIDPKAKD